MRLSQLRKLSRADARDAYCVGRISRFEMNFANYLRGEIDWPAYTPHAVAALREKLGLTQDGLALLLKVSPKTVLRWETESGSIPSTAAIALCVLEKLDDGVFDLMNPDAAHLTVMESKAREDAEGGIFKSSIHAAGTCVAPEVFGPTEIKILRDRFRLSRKAFAELLEVSPSTVDKWEGGSVTPKGPALAILKLVWVHGIEVLD